MNLVRNVLLLLILIVFSNINVKGQNVDNIDDIYNFINPFIGTSGDGHTYPGATVPFGMVQLSPDTYIGSYKNSYNWCSGYQYNDSSIIGFSHTHFSGTGHSDMGDILIMPTVGSIQLNKGDKENPDKGYRSRYDKNSEFSEPGYYFVFLSDYKIKAELTATNRVGVHKYSFPETKDAHIIIDLESSIYNYNEKIIWNEMRVNSNTQIIGSHQTRGWARNRHIYYAIEFSKPFKSWGHINSDDSMYGHKKSDKIYMNKSLIQGRKIKAVLNFDTKKNEVIVVKVGISAVSMAGALKNLNAEVPAFDFNKVRKEAKQKWLNELNKIFIKASEREKEIFYTSLYHTFLSPVTYSDVDGKYRGVDNNIHQSNDFTNYTIFSLWDTYRATHPLFTITQEKRVNDMIKSMLAHYEQSIDGILPIWSFHANENWCMIGYHAVSVIADAYVKGIRDYDTEKAWQAVKASSTYKDYDGLNYYMNKGFIPGDKESESVSKVLEYAYDDYAISQMAKAMVKKTDYDNYIERAQNYRNLYHEKTKFLRAKNTDGSWKEPFDPLHVSYYDADYTEGNAWQYTWYVPQDVMGLISLMGGENEFVLKLDSLFALEDVENKHLEVEDISGLIGQYAHGNEPSQHIAYLYNWAKQPWRTQERIHQIMNNLFDNTPDGICGNEDCGQMSSWYIFSSMGFYPVAPGSNQYIIGSPCIKEARIQLKDKNEFVIKAPKLNKENIYIQSLILNGEKINRSYIYHDEIMQGGELIFNMGNVPNKKWAVQNSSLPFSISE